MVRCALESRGKTRLEIAKDGGRSWSDEAITMAFPNDEVSVYEQRICQLDSGTIIDIAWNENLKTGKRLPNHISYSTDGGRTFSAPISTGIMGQAASVTALGDERFLAVVARRRDTDRPGVYGYVVDFSDKTLKVVKEKVLWEPGGVVSPTSPNVVTSRTYAPLAIPPGTAANAQVARWPFETVETVAVARTSPVFRSRSFADSPSASSVIPLPRIMNSPVPWISPIFWVPKFKGTSLKLCRI